MIRAQERQAKALEELVKLVEYNFGGPAKVNEVYAAEDEDLTYTTDRDTYLRQQEDARRLYRPRTDEEGFDAG